MGPPRLRLGARTPSAARPPAALHPDTPLAEIKGVGPKSAARLAALDLWVARDLVRYYPRDYLDYSNLVRIAALEPGRTATIVASVRRSHSFTSPRNPNLSILELQLVDPTGRIRISKFFAGKRFSSPAWLKAQQRQYPTGATRGREWSGERNPLRPCVSGPADGGAGQPECAGAKRADRPAVAGVRPH